MFIRYLEEDGVGGENSDVVPCQMTVFPYGNLVIQWLILETLKQRGQHHFPMSQHPFFSIMAVSCQTKIEKSTNLAQLVKDRRIVPFSEIILGEQGCTVKKILTCKYQGVRIWGILVQILLSSFREVFPHFGVQVCTDT